VAVAVAMGVGPTAALGEASPGDALGRPVGDPPAAGWVEAIIDAGADDADRGAATDGAVATPATWVSVALLGAAAGAIPVHPAIAIDRPTAMQTRRALTSDPLTVAGEIRTGMRRMPHPGLHYFGE